MSLGAEDAWLGAPFGFFVEHGPVVGVSSELDPVIVRTLGLPCITYDDGPLREEVAIVDVVLHQPVGEACVCRALNI